jgi:hypothetical protein
VSIEHDPRSPTMLPNGTDRKQQAVTTPDRAEQHD